jgi:transcriptional regulator with XRE-family HTH domain
MMSMTWIPGSSRAARRSGPDVRTFDLILLRLKQATGLAGDQDVAALLGMKRSAFSARKQRDAFPVARLHAAAARDPDAHLDVDFILTGKSNGAGGGAHAGGRLRGQREALSLTQADAAALCGISREMWGRYEREAAMPGADVLAAMTGAGFDVAHILTGKSVAPRATSAEVRYTGPAAALEAARALRSDEAELLAAYQRCSSPDQHVIRQMVVRLAGDTPSKSTRKKNRS